MSDKATGANFANCGLVFFWQKKLFRIIFNKNKKAKNFFYNLQSKNKIKLLHLQKIMIDILEKEQEAKNNFRKGYNCCQSVLLAYRDVLQLDEQTILKIGSGLGGGLARMREVCGCVSAMGIIAGFIKPALEPGNLIERKKNYELVQQLALGFKNCNGSIICREILKKPKEEKIENPMPLARTPEYYKTRPCERLCGDSARIIAQYINNIE